MRLPDGKRRPSPSAPMPPDILASTATRLLLVGASTALLCSCQQPDPPSPLLMEKPGVRAMISRADDLDGDCRSQMDSQTNARCEARDALYERLRREGICWGPRLAFWYRKSWIPCDRMNDMVLVHAEG